MFEVVDLRWGIQPAQATDYMTTELCLEELDRCRKTSLGPAFVALLGDQYGPCPVPTLIEEKEWEALKAQLTTRPGDLELVAHHFRRDENTVPPSYVLQALGTRDTRGPEEASLTSVLRSGAQEARRLGLITQEQWHRYQRSAPPLLPLPLPPTVSRCECPALAPIAPQEQGEVEKPSEAIGAGSHRLHPLTAPSDWGGCQAPAAVIEWEIERGLLSSTDGEQGATVFLREIRDLNRHILEDCALKLVDRLADGCLDTDAQNLLSSLKGRIADMQPGVLKAHHLPWSRDLVNPKNKAHARYLQELGEQFVARANHQVLQRLRELEAGRQDLAWLYQEIRHHLGLSAEATKTFCGRQDLLARLGRRLRQSDGHPHTPLVLFGPPGIGKTALMCKLAEQMPGLLGCKTVAVLRLLGTSQMSRDARGLLRSICFQVCLAYGLPLPPAQVLEAHSRVVQFFHTLLHTVSCRNFESLVILLDAVDDVDSAHRGRRVPWLPPKCPPRVHLIFSACSGQRGVLDTVQQTLKDPESYWEVEPLSSTQGQEMIGLLLAASRRTLSPGQRDLLWAGLPECGHPGQLRLAFEEARKWASFTVPAPLASAAEDMLHELCARLERTHGQLLVARVLGYIVSSRHGLSEAELKDVLSLDDEVLQAVYQDWTPPSKELLRFPPLLWVRLRRDLGSCLARRPVDGFTLLAVAHRQLAKVVRERYLSGPEKATRHGILADFFLGAWSQGMKKLITLPLVGKPLNLDRKVAPQPLWFSDTVANLRKLEELPYHLLHSGRLEELKQEVLGSMSWISCRGVSGGIESLLDDFDLCAPHVDCPEVGLVQEALQLCRPAVELRGLERSILYTEILARLYFFATSHPALVGELCQQAQRWFRECPHPVLVPLGGFLQPPGGPLRATLTGCHKERSILYTEILARLYFFATSHPALVGELCQQAQCWFRECPHPVLVPLGGFLQPPGGPLRATLTGCHKGITAMAWSLEEKLLVVGTQDGIMAVWDMEEHQVIHILTGHTGEVRCVTVFASGTQAISASKDRTLRLWHLLSGQEKFTIWDGGSKDPAVPQSLHVDEARKVVYSASGSKVNAWNLETAELIFHIRGDASDPWICTAALASQATLLTVSAGGVVSLWSSATGKVRGKQHLSSIKEETPTCGVSVQKPGHMVVGFSKGSICLVSSEGDSLLGKLPEAVGFLVTSEDESLLAAGSV
ncbi:NACHT and WD repeat domain-containing protein 1 [Myotis davidii]|uniref:NACHT and WD repeat domain-containing protein 1 n=1 Tax=Myotis davidii TaxID=225400 RepID=L5LJZ1_MYODS|nr:NACHT and WD repeat domain-containing protein 1 [Myotis davidii]